MHEGIDVAQSHPRQDDRELVTTGSEHGVGCPQPFTEGAHQGGEGSVALGVTLRIVDALQAVEVDGGHHQFGSSPAGARHRPGEHQIEGPTVTDSGQRVDEGCLFQLGERRPGGGVGDRPPRPVVGDPIGLRCDAQRGVHRGLECTEPGAHERRRLVGLGPPATGLGQRIGYGPAGAGAGDAERTASMTSRVSSSGQGSSKGRSGSFMSGFCSGRADSSRAGTPLPEAKGWFYSLMGLSSADLPTARGTSP